MRHLAGRHGIQKVRLTGGEPTSRTDLTDIMRRIAATPGVDDLAMTTNGLTLARRAEEYAAAGLRRVNVSLDSLDPQRFRRITGVDGLGRVLAGIEMAGAAGLAPIRINTVVIRGENDDELCDLLCFAAAHRHEIRFIELMPMGPLAGQWADRYVPEQAMRRRLDRVVTAWQPFSCTGASARRFRVKLVDGHSTTVGFITPMSCHFCGRCDRIRVASDGTLYPCLMDRPSLSLLPALRPRLDPLQLDQLLTEALRAKAPAHPTTGFAVMQQIGG